MTSYTPFKNIILHNARVLTSRTQYHMFLHDMIQDIWSQRDVLSLRRELLGAQQEAEEVLIFPKDKIQGDDECVEYKDIYGLKYNCFLVCIQAFKLQEKLNKVPMGEFGGYFRVSLSPFTKEPILEYKVQGKSKICLLVDIDKL